MGGGDLNMKKSWHPLLIKNQERVWQQEQEALNERKKILQLQRERDEERQLEELQRAAMAKGGATTRNSQLDWMYQAPAQGGGPNTEELEDYLLGKKTVDKLFKQKDEEAKRLQANQAGPSGSGASFQAIQNANNARDTASKIREDPLLAIKQQEQSALQALMRKNPGKQVVLGAAPELTSKERKEREKEVRRKEKDERKKERDERRREREDRRRRKERGRKRSSEESDEDKERYDRRRDDSRSGSDSEDERSYRRRRRDSGSRSRSRSPVRRHQDRSESPRRRYRDASPPRHRYRDDHPAPRRDPPSYHSHPYRPNPTSRPAHPPAALAASSGPSAAERLAAMQSNAARANAERTARIQDYNAADAIEAEEERRRKEKAEKSGHGRDAFGAGAEFLSGVRKEMQERGMVNGGKGKGRAEE